MSLDRRTLAFTVVGMFLGASAMLAYQGSELAYLHKVYNECQNENRELEDQIHVLSTKLSNPNSEPVVEGFQIQVQAPDGITQMEVIQFVKNQLEFLKDSRLSDLETHPDLPVRIIEGRTLTVDHQPVTLHVTTVVISKKLFLSVTATPGGTG